MVGNSLNFFNAFNAEICFGLNVMQSIIRHNAQFVHGFAGKNFHAQHGAEFVFKSPDIAHFRIGIAFNHIFAPQSVFYNKKQEAASFVPFLNDKTYYPFLSYHL